MDVGLLTVCSADPMEGIHVIIWNMLLLVPHVQVTQIQRETM